jgi:mannitol-1-phosphate/altronate dehydrogenase
MFKKSKKKMLKEAKALESDYTFEEVVIFVTEKGYVIDPENKTISVQGAASLKNIYMDIKKLLATNSDALEYNITCICRPTEHERWRMSDEHSDWKIKEIH